MSLTRRYMIDFETFGTSPNACVVQIGAASFDKTKQLKININPQDAQRNGARIDADTVMWWLKQSDAARNSLSTPPGIEEFLAWQQLNDFLKDAQEIWSHATFDFVILAEALKRLGIKPSFSYRCARDIRTLQALHPPQVKVERKGVHHDALDDCLHQIDYCMVSLFQAQAQAGSVFTVGGGSTDKWGKQW